ncbi:2-oxo acid dehydrogenase subunit E2 [Armatimonas sp.]|uniref:2-oxo acid dehydrogenase subunit E2 n=1 Tax=Armatimonas sp. TaxID=1872638 RepID=UPI003751A946
MARTVKVPVLGQSVEEVRIVQWFKKVGDMVAIGEALGELETDKTNMEFASTEAGVILGFLAPVDAYVKVESPVVLVGEPGEAPAVPIPPSPSPAREPLGGPLDASPRARRIADELGVIVKDLAGKGTGPGGRIIERDVEAAHATLAKSAQVAQELLETPAVRVSPLAQAIATGEGVNLTDVAGSGTGGRITADDVRAVTVPISVPASDEGGGQGAGARTVKLSGLRKRVADNLSKSVREKPHVTLHLAVDMTEANKLRKQLLPAIEKSDNVRISPTDFIIKACGHALKEHPMVNAHIDGDTITLFDVAHIGMAVSLGDEGLIVPVIKEVQSKGLTQLAKDRVDLAARARAGKLASNEVSGGTFTITNLGNYGVQAFNPIISPPQVAILGICAITDTIVAVNGQPTVRPMMGLSLSFDHRALDGAPAAAFLARLKELLETPGLLLA